MEELKFKISSGLKNLIGKELITDEYIAIFELVKNSFDAHAKHVKVIFENIYDEKKARIIILDDGKGMNIDDLREKWLFVAYSAKNDGTEDSSGIDYRNRIQPKRVFAGAKGVGRFSCDRLGSTLSLITIKNEVNPRIENLSIDWSDFENNTKEEFVEIGISHTRLTKTTYKINHGTVLEIGNLRDSWDRSKLLKLRKSLEKLINPATDTNDFSIEIIVEDEKKKDKMESNEWNKVNGLIKNTVFEKLEVKTTQIINEISKDGTRIISSLYDRGKFIFQVEEKNPFIIKNIKINLFYLNRAAKLSFSNKMGIPSVQYGSVFMYKNGFRIYPYGEVGEDPLNLDKRKAQGYNRYLGTRELIGRIEIYEGNEGLKETTSRDGGFIKTKEYEQLVEFFYEKSLKTLEKYVVNIIKWGEPFNKGDNAALNPEDVKKEIVQFIKKLTSSNEDLIEIKFNKDFIELIEESQKNSTSSVIANLAKKALETSDDPEFHKGLEDISKKVKQLINDRQEIEKEKEKADRELKMKKKELEHSTSQNLFLKSVASTDTKELISLQHHINHGTNRITKYINKLKKALQTNVKTNEINNYLQVISLENNKISTMSKFVTKANFNTTSSMITNDLVTFVNEYIENVYKEYRHLQINNKTLQIEISTPNDLEFIMKFRPLEIIIIIDNLLNNSIKAGARNVTINWKSTQNNTLEMVYHDDGYGISDEIVEHVFDFGFTTTNGSGLGLYHIDQIIKKMGGYIKINNKIQQGVEFILGVKA